MSHPHSKAIVCFNRYKNSSLVKIILGVFGCILLCFVCIFGKSDILARKVNGNRYSTEKLIQEEWPKPISSIEVHDFVVSGISEEGSGDANIETNFNIVPEIYNTIPIMLTDEPKISSEFIIPDVDNHVSGTIGIPDIFSEPINSFSTIEVKEPFQNPFTFSNSQSESSMQDISNLANIEMQFTNLKAAPNIFEDEAEELNRITRDQVFTIKEVSSKDTLSNSAEPIFAINDLFIDNESVSHSPELELSRDSSLELNPTFVAEVQPRLFASNAINDDYITVKKIHLPNVRDQVKMPSLFDAFLSRMSTLLPPIQFMSAPASRHPKGQQLKPNHLANFKETPFKGDHLKLETTLHQPLWSQRDRRNPTKRVGPAFAMRKNEINRTFFPYLQSI